MTRRSAAQSPSASPPSSTATARQTSSAAPTSGSTSRSARAKIDTLRDRVNRYLIANWKMNVPPEGIGAYLDALGGAAGGAALGVAPPYVYVKDVVAAP